MKPVSFQGFIAVILIVFPYLIASGQDPGTLNDEVNDERIKTVQLFKEEWNLSFPVISLNSNDKLVLNFDLLTDNPVSYYYTFIHCDKDWKESSIFTSDYIEGQPEDIIEDYKPSFNTKINYYHYRIAFPNENIRLKLSGNYIIKVYTPGEADRPVLTRRFMVTGDIVKVVADVHRPQVSEYYNTGQQVDFNVYYQGLTVTDPYSDFSSFILKNGNWNDAKINLKADFIGDNELRYNSLSAKNIFLGGNEFRYFDIKSIRYQSEFIRKIDFIGTAYHVYLYPSDNREFKPYFYWQDFNGKYYVAVQDGRDMDTEADYLYVYFTIPSKYSVPGGKLYVSGALNSWAFNKENVMTWDSDNGEYQCTMLLKQGWYNYEYIFLKEGQLTAEPSVFEGNHYETENDYLILVYYRDHRDRYDRLVGSLVANSAKTGR